MRIVFLTIVVLFFTSQAYSASHPAQKPADKKDASRSWALEMSPFNIDPLLRDKKDSMLLVPAGKKFLEGSKEREYLYDVLWTLISAYTGDWVCEDSMTFKNVSSLDWLNNHKITFQGNDQKVYLYDVKDKKLQAVFGDSSEIIRSGRWKSDGSHCAIAGNTVRLIDQKSNSSITLDIPGRVEKIMFGQFGDHVMIVHNGTYDWWDLQGKKIATVEDAYEDSLGLGGWLVRGRQGVRLYHETADGKHFDTRHPVKTFPHEHLAGAVADDSRVVTYGEGENEPLLWNEKQEPIAQLHGLVTPVTQLLLEKNILLGRSRGGQVCMWDIKDGKQKESLKNLPVNVTSLSSGPDDTVFICSEDQKAHLWDLETGEHVTTLLCSEPIYHAVYSEKLKRVLTLSQSDKDAAGNFITTVRFWKPLEL